MAKEIRRKEKKALLFWLWCNLNGIGFVVEEHQQK